LTRAGSFGVKEDDFFELASQYARAHRLPRVYISCNSGARIGLVESLKPLFKVRQASLLLVSRLDVGRVLWDWFGRFGTSGFIFIFFLNSLALLLAEEAP
jgi:hypothetical protein